MAYSPEVFENDVRRVARQLWPSAGLSGATNIDGQERDGYFETEECIYIVEATCDRKKSKAEHDATKIQKLIQKKKGGEKAVVGYIVTLDEPTADQRDIVMKIQNKSNVKINILSFSQFQAKIIDVDGYLSLRKEYFFGSIHNPKTGKYDNNLKYVDNSAYDDKSCSWNVNSICESVANGGKFVVIGDYGAGKSMTLRAIYERLVGKYHERSTRKFPVYINLREHQKQFDIDEILERHARKLGFENKSSLVRAWNLGYCHLILDGFDEMMSTGLSAKRKKMRDIRHNIVRPIRDFIKSAREDVGIVVAGRQSYFDTAEERIKSLGTSDFIELRIGDFSNEHVEEFLKTYGIKVSLPAWIPTRPLLLGTLLLKGYLETGSTTFDPAIGWDMLLTEIAERESKIENSGVDAEAIRIFLETLATMARNTDDGLGSLTYENITAAFLLACEYEPDEETLVLLLRLPGLGYDPNDHNVRRFIDKDFADACAAGFLFNSLSSYNENMSKLFNDVQCHLLDVGYAMFEHKCKAYTQKQIGALLNSCLRQENQYVKSDAVMLMQRLNIPIVDTVYIQGVSGKVCIDCEFDMHNVTYADCVFDSVEIDGVVNEPFLPKFQGSYIEKVDGIFESSKDLLFDDNCQVFEYVDDLKTTNAIMNTPLDTQVKVLVSILKKLYIQRGAGRLESAFLRGLDTNAKRYVGDILRLLQTEGLAVKLARSGKEIWLAEMRNFPRVGKIISAPMTCNDKLVSKVVQL